MTICLDTCKPDQNYEKFTAHSVLYFIHWLKGNPVPEGLLDSWVQVADVLLGNKDPKSERLQMALSVPYVAQGHWTSGIEIVSAKNTWRREPMVERIDVMTPPKALAWAFAHLRSAAPTNAQMEEKYRQALNAYLLRDDGTLKSAMPLFWTYQRVFSQESAPVSLLSMLRVGRGR